MFQFDPIQEMIGREAIRPPNPHLSDHTMLLNYDHSKCSLKVLKERRNSSTI